MCILVIMCPNYTTSLCILSRGHVIPHHVVMVVGDLDKPCACPLITLRSFLPYAPFFIRSFSFFF